MTHEEFLSRFQFNYATDKLGEGGFGKVYKAYDTHRDRFVAIKAAEVKEGFESVRLKKEVEMVNQLPSHPNIAYYEECYTFSTFNGEFDFGILQYYEEGNLLQLIQNKTLTFEQKEFVLKQLLDGISFLHQQGIIHRDLKPQNILIVKRNNHFIPKIADFGISKKLDIYKSSIFSNSLMGAGTLAYSSPEQLGDKSIRKNTDLWSFGVIAYQLLTGELPFNTGPHSQTSEAGRNELYRQINTGILPAALRSIPENWQNLISECLMTQADVRISNVEECLEVLKGGHYEKKSEPIKEKPSDDTVFSGKSGFKGENEKHQAEEKPAPPSPKPKPEVKKSGNKQWITIVFGGITFLIAKFAIFDGEMSMIWGIVSFAVGSLMAEGLILILAEPGKPAVPAQAQPVSEPIQKAKAGPRKKGKKSIKYVWFLISGIALILIFVAVILLKGKQKEDYIEYVQVNDKLVGDIQMVYVKGGKMELGEPGDFRNPVREVIVEDMYISSIPVLYNFYDNFCDETDRVNPDDFGWGRTDNLPVVNVTWKDAVAFCDWLSNVTGKKYSLPTQDQWEYAARGGQLSHGYVYSGSDSIDEVAYYNENSNTKLNLPYDKQPNELNLYEMSGNVSEWCLDTITDEYCDDCRPARGGAFNSEEINCKVTSLFRVSPNYSMYNLGFRIVCNE